MNKGNVENAVRLGREALIGIGDCERWPALMALRTVCFHLDLFQLYGELDAEVQQVLERMKK